MEFNKKKFKGMLVTNGITYEVFAQKMEMKLPTFKYNIGNEKMSLSFFLKICEKLNVEPADLLVKK
jgi:DNA-binding Xre family transcriptional regulator